MSSSSLDEQKAKAYHVPMDESRKRVIGIMAAILAARKLAQLDRSSILCMILCANVIAS